MNPTPHFLLIAAFVCPVAADPVFQEKKGIVAIEAESTTSRLGKWNKKTDVDGYLGECHLEFTGNKPESGPPNSPLKYSFLINKDGTYELFIRARKRLETKRADISNDCFVALKGDFESGGDAPLKLLKNDTKLYGGNPNDWGWTSKLDEGHKKYAAAYQLKAGETYELTVSGRSKNFNIDRILFIHESQNSGEVRRDNPKESKSDAAASSSGSKLSSYTQRTLKNKDGKSIDAQLVNKDDDAVEVLVRGRRFKIDISTLSEDDQEFIKDWSPQ